MKIERFRKFNTRDVYPGQTLDNDVCMVAKAGNRIFMRGQTGLDLDQNMVGAEDAGEFGDEFACRCSLAAHDIFRSHDGGPA